MKDASFWNVTIPRILSSYAFVMFVILWVGFATTLVANRAWLDALWYGVKALPSAARLIVWLVFLPIMVGLWVWESSWPTLVHLAAWAGMVIWTLMAVSSFLRAIRQA